MKKWVKKTLASLMIASFLPISAFAEIPGYDGGIRDEYNYEEYVFISGEPIKFIGKADGVKEKQSDKERSITINLKLTSEDAAKQGSLTRTITYNMQLDPKTDKGQTVGNITPNKMKETITLGKNKYELQDYQFSNSRIIDNRPASDFYSGNFKGKKTYTINKTEGTVIVDSTGGEVGYQNFWGDTTTQISDNIITYKRSFKDSAGDATSDSWNGTYRITTYDSINKILKYSVNDANFSSFDGGNMRITNQELVSKYDFDLPILDKDGRAEKSKRDLDQVSATRKMVPKIERLLIPKFRDTKGHWAQSDIEKLYSLDVFDDLSKEFFIPDVGITRLEFIKALMNACEIRPEPIAKKKVNKKGPKEESLFKDMNIDDPDYRYVKSAYEKGIVTGFNNKNFGPNEVLTKSEIVTLLVRALGFENKAPTPGFYTTFADDRQIPFWAKDGVYVAKEIGILTGDENNRFNPQKLVTRAEASAMLVRFLEFLQKDLQKDYKENIIYFK